MNNRRHLRRLPLTVLLGLLVAAVLFGCESIEAPDYNNPLDPQNPDGDDPFQLTATYVPYWVKLEWVLPTGPAIDQIIIENVIYSDGLENIVPIDTVASNEDEYFHNEPEGNALNYYRLVAMDASGRVAQTSHVVPAQVLVPPIMFLPDAVYVPNSGPKIFTADQAIEVRAVLGDVAQVDTLEDFSSMPIVPIVDGVGRYEHVRLLKQRFGDVIASSRQLYVRAGVVGQTDTSWSEVTSQLLLQELTTGMNRTGGGATVAEPLVDITLGGQGAGIDSVRFANTQEGLASAPWLAAEASFDSIPLLDTPNAQALYAQYASSYGDIVDETPLELTADDLTAATVTPELPSNGIVSGLQVKLAMDAVATEMRVSTDIGFSDTDWQPYADELMVTLADEPGTQTVYTQFRNHWFEPSESLVTTLQVSASVLDLSFDVLADGVAVRGGNTLEVSGTVGPVPDGYELASVEWNLGNGFVPITEPDEGWDSPTATWSDAWPVPLFAADTPFMVGLQAVAEEIDGDDERSGTIWVEVIISQLTLTIDTPMDGDQIMTGNGVLVEIEGTTTTDLTGSPVDSVVVDAVDATITATEALEAWSVEWAPSIVEADTTVTITATVYAGEEELVQSVDITLIPPSPLTLTIDSPLDGDQIVTGDGVVVDITGTAVAAFTGTPLDSVVVAAGDTTVTLSEDLASWSVGWTPGVASESTAAVIEATVHAGEDTLHRRVDVTLLPPAEEE